MFISIRSRTCYHHYLKQDTQEPRPLHPFWVLAVCFPLNKTSLESHSHLMPTNPHQSHWWPASHRIQGSIFQTPKTEKYLITGFLDTGPSCLPSSSVSTTSVSQYLSLFFCIHIYCPAYDMKQQLYSKKTPTFTYMAQPFPEPVLEFPFLSKSLIQMTNHKNNKLSKLS